MLLSKILVFFSIFDFKQSLNTEGSKHIFFIKMKFLSFANYGSDMTARPKLMLVEPIEKNTVIQFLAFQMLNNAHWMNPI